MTREEDPTARPSARQASLLKASLAFQQARQSASRAEWGAAENSALLALSWDPDNLELRTFLAQLQRRRQTQGR